MLLLPSAVLKELLQWKKITSKNRNDCSDLVLRVKLDSNAIYYNKVLVWRQYEVHNSWFSSGLMGLKVIMAVQLKTFSLRSYSFGVGLCDVDKKNLSRFLDFSISILITILTQTDMLYGYRCILCEFETYFQRKPIRPFPKSCSMSLEQTYGKIHICICE